MTQDPQDPKNVANRLTHYLLTHPSKEDIATQMTDAIVAIYGSLDTFYQLFYQFLSQEERDRFAHIVEQKLREAHGRTIQDVMRMGIFQEIVKTLRRHNVSDVGQGKAGGYNQGPKKPGKGDERGR